jgi:hypothetical protein
MGTPIASVSAAHPTTMASRLRMSLPPTSMPNASRIVA